MPSKTDINPKTGQMYAVNPATGNFDDNYWANVVEPQLRASAGGTTGNTAQQLIQASIDKYTKQTEEYTKKYKEFDVSNPFDWDKILGEERTKVTQRLEPYYTQTLNDYLQGIETKRTRSAEDERTILSEINADVDFYKGQSAQTLIDAIGKSREGYADTGLLSSGQALRGEGQLATTAGTNLQRYLTTAERATSKATLAGQRLGEDLTLEERIKRRDLAQEKGYNVETGALTGRTQRLGQWQFEKGQYTGAPPGTNPLLYDQSLYGFLQ